MSGDMSIYWNPILETLPPEKLRVLQVKKFKRIFEWAYNNSPFYRKLYKDAGIRTWRYQDAHGYQKGSQNG